MAKAIASITTSVDGYIAGPDDGPGKGLGDGGERLPYGPDESAGGRSHPPLLLRGVLFWPRLHGLISLELDHHLASMQLDLSCSIAPSSWSLASLSGDAGAIPSVGL
jgi:hypothetical protein